MKEFQLRDIADIRLGHPFRGSIPIIEEGNTNVVQVRDINYFDEININNLVKTELKGRKSPDWLFPKDILFVCRGARHFATIVKDVPENTVCSPHFFLIRLRDYSADKTLPEFISWQLNQKLTQRYFVASAEGSNQISVRKQELEQTPIVLPPIESQRCIVNIHNTAIKEKKLHLQLIENRQQQLEVIAKKILLNQVSTA